MKRTSTRSILQYFSKPKVSKVVEDTSASSAVQCEDTPTPSSSAVQCEDTLTPSSSVVQCEDTPPSTVQCEEASSFALPDCWTMQQYEDFKTKYDGLDVKDKGLGCLYCTQVAELKTKGVHVSKQWRD